MAFNERTLSTSPDFLFFLSGHLRLITPWTDSSDYSLDSPSPGAQKVHRNSVVGGGRVRTVISHQADEKELIRYFVTSLLSEPDDQLTKYRMSFWLLDG